MPNGLLPEYSVWNFLFRSLQDYSCPTHESPQPQPDDGRLNLGVWNSPIFSTYLFRSCWSGVLSSGSCRLRGWLVFSSASPIGLTDSLSVLVERKAGCSPVECASRRALRLRAFGVSP